MLLSVACSGDTGLAPGSRGPQIVFDGLNAAILSVSGTAADDIYAVGADPGDGLGPYVLHYDGAAWRRLISGAAGDLWWISVEMIDGSYYMAGEGGKILRFTPATSEFQQHILPGKPTIFGVWGDTSDDLWAVGGDPQQPDLGGVIARFDGQRWRYLEVSESLPEPLPTLYKVWGRNAVDVYIVGRRGIILHFDGADWSRVSNDTQSTLFTVHGNGAQVVASGGIGNAVIAELQADEFVNQAEGIIQMNGVFIPPQGGGVTVGNRASMAIRTTAGWELQHTGVDSSRDLHAVWIDPEGGVWAVGGRLSASLDQGIILYSGAETISTKVISE